MLLFAAYYANITLFTHYHVVDGVTIVHSHIHGEDHTSEQGSASDMANHLTLIQMLSNYLAELQNTPIYIVFLLIIEWSYSKIIDCDIPISRYRYAQLRAPPVQISFR